jgi:hypothetical protein
MDSVRHESRSVRGKLVAVLAIALAFAAGLALRLWTDESDAVVPTVAKRVDTAGAPQPIRLVRIDPGALRRPTVPPSDGGTAVSAQPGSAQGPVAVPVAPAPGSAPPGTGGE